MGGASLSLSLSLTHTHTHTHSLSLSLSPGTVTFIGSHLDVVPANPETWERNPFKLKVEVHTVNIITGVIVATRGQIVA